jgi:hypothetical protein
MRPNPIQLSWTNRKHIDLRKTNRQFTSEKPQRQYLDPRIDFAQQIRSDFVCGAVGYMKIAPPRAFRRWQFAIPVNGNAGNQGNVTPDYNSDYDCCEHGMTSTLVKTLTLRSTKSYRTIGGSAYDQGRIAGRGQYKHSLRAPCLKGDRGKSPTRSVGSIFAPNGRQASR